MIKVNGIDKPIEEVNLLQYLLDNGYSPQTIAVECNEEIVPRSEFASFIIHSGDVIEIVSFVGGG